MKTTTSYVIKYIDEYGGCYHQIEVDDMQKRQEIVREWLQGNTPLTSKVGDVTVVQKNSGEELWLYENVYEQGDEHGRSIVQTVLH